VLCKLGQDGYDPDEPRIPKHHTGGGEWTSSSVAAADNTNDRPYNPLPIPIPEVRDEPQEQKPPYEPPARNFVTDFYEQSIRQPFRDISRLVTHPEEIPDAIASVAPGLGPIAEVPLVVGEVATSIRAIGRGAMAERAVGTAVETANTESAAVDGTVSLSRARFGQAAEHAADAQAAGQPSILRIDRAGAAANRAAATGGTPRVSGMQLDEYPPAMFKEGGTGASVRAIEPADNMSAGAYIGNCCRKLPDGSRVRIKITE
jgi:hypothetical protein